MTVKRSFRQNNNKTMPKGKKLAASAQKQLKLSYEKIGVDLLNPTYLKSNCDQTFYSLLNLEFELYRREEIQINNEFLWSIFKDEISSKRKLSKSEIEIIIKKKFSELRIFFKSISQSRSSRAGGSAQNYLAFIFSILGYPFEPQPKLDGIPDFILPNKTTYQTNPAECVLVTVKRTLRERWRQIIIEGFKSPQYFLFTIDEKQSLNGLQEMANNRIYLVIPEEIISKVLNYKNAVNVISLNSFLINYLDPAILRWRQSGIIT